MANTWLTESLQKATQHLTQRINIGLEIMSQPSPGPLTKSILSSTWDSIKKWDDYNSTFLRKLFSDESVADKYDASAEPIKRYSSLQDLANKILFFHRVKTRELVSIKERLKLYDTVGSQVDQSTPSNVKPNGNKVFIVHGHNDAMKETLARFLEKLDLEVVILHEKPDKGKTIIEKLEANSSQVDIGYAVVLLTPDDLGGPNEHGIGFMPELQNRARQNVVFELGYFIAKLGRERVYALFVDGVELPSDYQGVLYTKIDASNSWMLKLAGEIKASGINLDLNKIL
jgi:predicted nucleotide-binding protein